MYAKNLEGILQLLSRGMEVSYTDPAEIAERFKSLRGSALLPRGHERREQRLTSREIACAVLSLVSVRPGWAAHGAVVLQNLHPVGGSEASFENAASLIEAIVRLIDDK